MAGALAEMLDPEKKKPYPGEHGAVSYLELCRLLYKGEINCVL